MSILLFCKDTVKIWSLVGSILNVFKIVVPLLIIIFGMIDLGKAVIASDEKAISKSTQSIIKRLIAGVVIFFIPTIVSVVFGLITSFSSQSQDFEICKKCITNPSNCKNIASLACTEVNGTYYGPNGEKLSDDKHNTAVNSGTRAQKKQSLSNLKTAKEKFDELCK